MKKIQIENSRFRQLKPLLTAVSLSVLAACANTRDRAVLDSKTAEQNKPQQGSPSSAATTDLSKRLPDLICKNAKRFAGRKVGDGHCVSLIRHCAGAPFTNQWRPAQKVLGADLPTGTIIATFKGQHYPSRHGYHAAIYIEQDKSGIWVWDQWRGKPVHRRLIKIRNDGADPGNTAQAYRVVRLNSN